MVANKPTAENRGFFYVVKNKNRQTADLVKF